jgi:hypothetical protein
MRLTVFLLFYASAMLIPWFDATVFGATDGVDSLSAAAAAFPLLRRTRGRPRKFAEPSRTLTLTLPESVLTTLSAIHADVSQAIVQLARRPSRRPKTRAADLLVYGQRAVITIRPTPSLELRAGVQLVPLPDGRALISLEAATSLAALQLSLTDALDDERLNGADRGVYEHLRDILREARRSADVTLQHRHIIVLEARRGRRGNGKAPAPGRSQRDRA